MAEKYKVEAFDKMQFFYGDFHDPLIRCRIRLSGHIDAGALKKAVTVSRGAIPLIGCCFDLDAGRPVWRDHGFAGDDIVRLMQADTPDCVESQLASTIDIFREPQLKIIIVREQDADTLCIIVNHMVCDGGGFKEYLYLLCDLYAKCTHGDISVPPCYPRGTAPLFKKFGWIQRFEILLSKYDLSMQKEQVPLPFQGDKRHPFFTTRVLTREALTGIKAYAKSRGASLNDMILAAYAWVLHARTGLSRIIIPCPVDLRKYIPDTVKYGICNFTSNFMCDITVHENDGFDGVLGQISSQIKAQKSSDTCLKPVLSLEIASRVMPFPVMREKFKEAYAMPVISYTNLGIIDTGRLTFDDVAVADAYLTGAVKHAPYFQISISTYDNACTLSSNMYGTKEDKRFIEEFLADVHLVLERT